MGRKTRNDSKIPPKKNPIKRAIIKKSGPPPPPAQDTRKWSSACRPQRREGDDNFRAIYRILGYLEKAMDLDELDLERISAESLKLTGRRWAAIMAMLVREQYVDGVSARWSGNGYAEVTMSSPRITLRGLEYLQENSLMQKAANLAKGIAEIIP